ncbi:hypothetical protein Peur_025810 [Populus x canadensis]
MPEPLFPCLYHGDRFSPMILTNHLQSCSSMNLTNMICFFLTAHRNTRVIPKMYG